jgi:phosphoribosylamine---glycine ligase
MAMVTKHVLTTFAIQKMSAQINNILLLGSGGREHALAQAIAKSPLCSQLYVAPGNPGTSQFGLSKHIQLNDFEIIKAFCLEHQINYIVVGPEEPLVRGIWDYFELEHSELGIKVLGPSKYAAQLEGSKAFSKAFMKRHNIPTAGYQEFTVEQLEQGIKYLQEHTLPIVLKADGLAAGKGVLICATHDEAITEFTAMLVDAKFGEASSKVVVEQFLDGIELSVFALTDGKDFVLLPEAKDYKRIGEGDTGLNTGGMGAISPVPFADEAFVQKVLTQIVQPTISGLAKEQIIYNGFVFFGLIKVNDEPFAIEYNCRMGDPETEVVLPRIDSDFLELLLHCTNNTMSEATVKISEQHAATVMCVSGGYPGDYRKGFAITNLQEPTGTKIYHAGTSLNNEQQLLTNGGRVLAITTLAPDLGTALAQSKKVAEQINFEGKYYRKDIGWEFIS